MDAHSEADTRSFHSQLALSLLRRLLLWLFLLLLFSPQSRSGRPLDDKNSRSGILNCRARPPRRAGRGSSHLYDNAGIPYRGSCCGHAGVAIVIPGSRIAGSNGRGVWRLKNPGSQLTTVVRFQPVVHLDRHLHLKGSKATMWRQALEEKFLNVVASWCCFYLTFGFGNLVLLSGSHSIMSASYYFHQKENLKSLGARNNIFYSHRSKVTVKMFSDYFKAKTDFY
jgi:hypothetical protein